MSALRIAMGATERSALQRPSARFRSARAAFEAYLRSKGIGVGKVVLLPAYIGWSAREGSGVMDPVRAVGAAPRFYRMTRSLEIDIEHLREQLYATQPSALVVIHFFGWPDPAWREAITLAAEHGVPVMEDEAHSWLSDVVGGVCGRSGEASIFSTHKLLPSGDGGELVANARYAESERCAAFAEADVAAPCHRADYDLTAIAARRVANAETVLRFAHAMEGISPLRLTIPPGVIPQTLPVVVRNASRDSIYFAMNEAGFGGTSLYHTLIDEISGTEFPDAHWLARRIFNLPVHQDAATSDLPAMMTKLAELLAP
ncbi:MAG: DegT/DnrJ/EryC1/StrS family aminotransferase [Gemmatimonadaceae bacterium]